MADVRLSLLGAPLLEIRGIPVELERRKTMALLAYLAGSNQYQSRETLAALLWPEADEGRARAGLRRELSILNKALGGDRLEIERDTIRLNPDSDLWVDVVHFEKGLATCRTHGHATDAVCPECLPYLREAVSLYRGDFMAGFTLRDSPIFDEWQHFQTEALRRELAEALERLVRGQGMQADFQAAIPYARQWVALDPLHEPAHRQLMELYARAGQRAAALHQYQECVRLLQEELGVPPAVETSVLAERIRLETAGQYGRLVKSYELRELIGAGGFGEVYQAYQPLVRREVAIKVILPQYANQPDFIRRFEAEAQVVAQLEHPHIVPLYDFWREPDGAYLVMRWLRGGSLEDILNQGGWQPEATAHLLDQITGALMLAHQRGIIHRDIKPANILLDELGNGYLSDFGIAKNIASATQTQPELVVGSPAYLAPELINGEPVTPQADIYSLGVMLYQLLTGRHPFSGTTPPQMIFRHLTEPLPSLQLPNPDLSAALNEVIQQATAKKPADRYADAIALATDFRQAVGSEQVLLTTLPDESTPLLTPNPYKGLHAFQEGDAANFFGRDTLVDQLLVRLMLNKPTTRRSPIAQSLMANLHNFLAIVGPSGSGKSSLVKAGLIPALRQNAIPGSKDWFIIEMAPGSQPLEELEAALLRIAIHPPPTLLDQLQADERGLQRAVKHILPNDEVDQGRTELLLVIDQFEEIFTLVGDEAVRRHFLDSLYVAVTEPESRLRVVITLRADYYDRPLLYPGFGDLLRQRMETILPLSSKELEQAIAGPAERVGATLETGLVPLIVSDVQEQPGTLPLMQYALTELFEQRQGRLLTINAYQNSGGVMGALARRADELYTDLNDAGRAVTHRLFMRLVSLGEGGRDGSSSPDTRRRVLRSELEAIGDDEDQKYSQFQNPVSNIQNVIDTFGRYRLLTFDRDPVTRVPTVEVAHEALLREWQRLREWLDQDREFLMWQQRLRTGLHQWQTNNYDQGALLRGAPLAEAENWLIQRRSDLTEAERKFIQAGLALREKRLVEREAQRRRELEVARELAETEKRRAEEQAQFAVNLRRRAMGLAGVGLVAVFLAVVAGIFGMQSSQNAERAIANEQIAVAERATAQAAGNLALEQEARAQREAERALNAEATAQAEKEIAEVERAEAQRQEEIALSRQLAAQSVTEFDKGNYVTALHLAIEAGTVANTSEAFNALRQPFPLAVPRLILSGHEDEVWGAQWNSDESLILTYSKDKTARVWDAVTGQERFWLGHKDPVVEARWNSDETVILTRGELGFVHIWDAASGQERFQLITPGEQPTQDAKWNKDENLILGFSGFWADGKPNTVHIWDAITGQERLGFQFRADGVKWNGDGSLILVYGCNPKRKGPRNDCLTGEVIVREAYTGQERLRLRHNSWVRDAQWNSDESLILTRTGEEYKDDTIHVWDVATGQERLQLTHEEGVEGVQWNDGGNLILIRSKNGTVHIWDAIAGQERFRLTHQRTVEDVRWNSDDGLILTYGKDNTARVWDAATGQELFQLVHEDWVLEARWSSDESLILTRSKDGTARVWDAATGQERFRLTHKDSVEEAQWNSDESLILTYSKDNTARVWDAATGQELFQLIHENDISEVRWSNNENLILTSSKDNTVRVWDVAARQDYAQFTHQDSILGARWNSDESLVLTNGLDNTARLWDAATGQERLTLSHKDGAVRVARWNRDESLILTGGLDNTIRVWDAHTGQEELRLTYGQESLKFREHDILDACWNSDESLILTGGLDNTGRVWDANTGQELLRLTHEDTVWNVCWNSDESFILTGSTDHTARVWDAVTGQERLRLSQESGVIRGAKWNSDESLILTSSSDHTVRVWDAVTGQERLRLTHPNYVWNARWNKDESLILTSCLDNIARVWDAATGQERLTLTHEDNVWDARWNSDETLILTRSKDNTVRVWDAVTGQERFRLTQAGEMWDARWNSDESLILTGSGDGTARIWNATLEGLLETACRHAPRNMTLEEWQQFLGDQPYRATCPDLPVANPEG